jgi:hypothetical protein
LEIVSDFDIRISDFFDDLRSPDAAQRNPGFLANTFNYNNKGE